MEKKVREQLYEEVEKAFGKMDSFFNGAGNSFEKFIYSFDLCGHRITLEQYGEYESMEITVDEQQFGMWEFESETYDCNDVCEKIETMINE